ncbi:hypothetical protein Taro_018823 [Colocasia esculenta]|uniref:Uncharacterized protein n=1 Tax=Colocasia esculenta TaxID=4460 RepID=A0A843UJK3_COLES|nr:hypothetical protein [Colocasia esculenta]
MVAGGMKAQGKEAAVPEPFRCRRTDGKQWRCSRRAKDGISFCELHHLQAQHRQARRPVPEALKLPHCRRGGGDRGSIPVAGPRRGPKKGKRGGRRGGRGRVGKKERGKKGREKKGNGELAMELIRMVLRQMLQRREEKEKRRREEAAAEERAKEGAGEAMEQKLELSSSSFLRWCFRSKNVERPPLVASSLMVSSGKGKTVGCERNKKRVCQFCQENCIRCLVRCSNCQKVIFCRACVKKWYPDVTETEVEMDCPICLGTCLETKDFAVKDSL